MLFSCVSSYQSLPAPEAFGLLSASRRLTHNRGGLFQSASMKKIPLTNSTRFALVDDRDFERVSKFSWRMHKGANDLRYAIRGNGKYWNTLHGFILNTRKMIDHRDSDGLNNCRRNLRLCSHTQNNANQRKRPWLSSKYKGVCFDKRCRSWHSRITFRGHLMHIGWFKVEEEAAIAYNIAAKKLFGKFARLNKIP